eukprot:3595527-Amphidinium_carterae.1
MEGVVMNHLVLAVQGWIEIAEAAMDKNRLWAVYFVAMISLTNFALVPMQRESCLDCTPKEWPARVHTCKNRRTAPH